MGYPQKTPRSDMRIVFDTAKWVDGGFIGPSLKVDTKYFALQCEPGYGFVRLWRWTWERISA